MIPNQKELQKGRSFELPDGSTVKVKLVREWINTHLRLLRNGKPLPGSGSDPRIKLKQSYGVIYFVGGLNFLLGLVATLFQIEFLIAFGMGFYSLIIGSIYLLLGYFVQRLSKAALIIAMVLYGLETIFVLTAGSVSAVFVRILFLIIMWGGFGAILELRAESHNGILHLE